jgi:diguanylate cyclase (GGDEF)-like protein
MDLQGQPADSSLLPCGGDAACLPRPALDGPLDPCPHGWRRRLLPVSLARAPYAYLVEFRRPEAPALELGAPLAEVLAHEAQARFELQRTIEELVSRYEELSVLYDSAEAVVSITNLDEVSQRILEQAAELLDVDHASLMLTDPEGQVLKVKAARGARADTVGKVEVPLGEGISGWVAREGRPLLIEDVRRHPMGRRAAREDADSNSLLCVPLKIKDRVLGVLNVNNKRNGQPFTSSDLKVLQSLSHLAAIAIENARTYQNAITDRLTRLYNYGYFKEQLEKKVEEHRLRRQPLSLLMFDIDHFKNFNDVNGHELANVVLVGVASICLNSCRQKGDRVPDLVARYGGEEFMIMLCGVDKEDAGLTAERIRARVESEHFQGGENQPLGRVTISMGVASFPQDAETSDELIVKADQALYRAKRAGRNNVQYA